MGFKTFVWKMAQAKAIICPCLSYMCHIRSTAVAICLKLKRYLEADRERARGVGQRVDSPHDVVARRQNVCIEPPGSGFGVQDSGYLIRAINIVWDPPQDVVARRHNVRVEPTGSGFGVHGTGCRVRGSEIGIHDSGFRVQGSSPTRCCRPTPERVRRTACFRVWG